MPDPSANEFLRLLQALSGAGVLFTIVGGTAAVLHGASTVTYDLDIVMAFTLENCAGLLAAVRNLHPRLSHTPDKEPLTLTATELSTFKNLYLLTDLGRLDILGSLPPIDSLERVFREAERVDVGGVPVCVVSLPILIEVKAAMGRPKDKQTEIELRAIQDVRKGGAGPV